MSNSQNNEILAYMKSKGAVSFYMALKEFGTLHLPRRIKDLKEAGHQISDEWVQNNRSGKRYKKYWLSESDYGKARSAKQGLGL